MAIIVIWDDSSGWHDHVMPTIINQAHVPSDALLGPGDAGSLPPGAYQGRLDPCAKRNQVDGKLTDHTSFLRFFEIN